jgi:hypothetical protein
MKRGTVIVVSLLMLVSAGLAVAAEQSLGDIARQFKQERSKETRKAAKLYTNDNLPPPAPWEEVTPPQAAAKATPQAETRLNEPGVAPTPSAPAGEKPDNQRTREYWQERFSAARRELAEVESSRRLAQDELSLLQIQQARELDPEIQSQLAGKIQAKQSEVAAIQARVEVAQKALDDLQKEFAASGAPTEWSETEEKPSSESQQPSP